jgi:hypothetical protein
MLICGTELPASNNEQKALSAHLAPTNMAGWRNASSTLFFQ